MEFLELKGDSPVYMCAVGSLQKLHLDSKTTSVFFFSYLPRFA